MPRFRVYVSCNDGSEVKLDGGLGPYSTVAELQREIERTVGIAVDHQALVVHSKDVQMDDADTTLLKHLGLADCSEVQMKSMRPTVSGVWIGHVLRGSKWRVECRLDFSNWHFLHAQQGHAQLEVEYMVADHRESDNIGRMGCEVFTAAYDADRQEIGLESVDVACVDDGPALSDMRCFGPSQDACLKLGEVMHWEQHDTPGLEEPDSSGDEDNHSLAPEVPIVYQQVADSHGSMELRLGVRNAGSEELSVSLPSAAASLASLTRQLARLFGVPPAEQMLSIVGGARLSRCRPLAPLSSLGITQDAKLSMVHLGPSETPLLGVWSGTYSAPGEGLTQDLRLDGASWQWLDEGGDEGRACRFEVEVTMLDMPWHPDCRGRRGVEIFEGTYTEDFPGSAQVKASCKDFRIIDGQSPPDWMDWLFAKEEASFDLHLDAGLITYSEMTHVVFTKLHKMHM
eukprot:TRINITY_DN90874_c0_g1_i1.p1 TRINITY_DN90874_c0_g1~~TRINITY_DN90874_c0_g1_i1.p1  ORF type:complete len:456 (-),score=107.52 TRINITY_DN90874_c0_g1_i1:69-1436(-)